MSQKGRGFRLLANLNRRRGGAAEVIGDAQADLTSLGDARELVAEITEGTAVTEGLRKEAEEMEKLAKAEAATAEARARQARAEEGQEQASADAATVLAATNATKDSKVSAADDAASLEAIRARDAREQGALAARLRGQARDDMQATADGQARATADLRGKQSDVGLGNAHNARPASELQAAEAMPPPVAVGPLTSPSAKRALPCKNRPRHRRDGRLLVNGVAGPRHRRDGVPARRLRDRDVGRRGQRGPTRQHRLPRSRPASADSIT